jgi:hypothetical protein
MRLKGILRDIYLFVAVPVIVAGIALCMLLFGDPVEDALEDDCLWLKEF